VRNPKSRRVRSRHRNRWGKGLTPVILYCWFQPQRVQVHIDSIGVEMRAWWSGLAVAGSLLVGGCGTTVPDIRDFPNNVGENQNNALVAAIIASVRCELRDAVTSVLNERNPDSADAYKAFLQKWGAQVALTLRLDEKTSINPSALSHVPTSMFTLVGGVS